MWGPVLRFELIRASRRGRHHQLAWFYAGWLLLIVIVLSLLYFVGGDPHDNLSHLAVDVVVVLLLQLFLVVTLATPAFAAGSIADEKSSGTLQEWLTTDLSGWEIVRGKWLGQAVQVGTLALATLPLVAFFGALANLPPLALAVVLATGAWQILAWCAVSLLASTWCRRTTAAVLLAYGLAAAMLVASARLLEPWWFSPLYLLEPAWLDPDSAQLRRRLLVATAGWAGIIAVCLAVASWGLRPAYLRQLAAEGQPSGNWRDHRFRPAVGEQPLRWKERWLGDLPAVPLLRRLPRKAGVIAVGLVALAVAAAILVAHLPRELTPAHAATLIVHGDWARLFALLGAIRPATDAFLMLGIAEAAFFSLAIGVRCAGAVSSERERQTWDALLTTPLEPRQILRGKLWGILDSTRPYLAAYLIVAAPLSLLGGWQALGWIVYLWLATWMLMYYTGASGIRSSARSQNSWRSLLVTLLNNARVLAVRFLMLGAPIGLLIAGLVTTAAEALGPRLAMSITQFFTLMFLFVSLSVTLMCLFAEAEMQLGDAELWIWKHERIPPFEARVIKSD